MIRPRLKMARQAITQQQQGQQPGARTSPTVAQQSNQGNAPTTQGRARAVYRPGGASGATSPSQTPSQLGGPRVPMSPFSDASRNSARRGNANNAIPDQPGGRTSDLAARLKRREDAHGFDANNDVPPPDDLVPDEPTEPESEEELIADMVRQYLEGVGNIDTTEQEALINQRMQEDLAMDLMNQRASAGASGFEASGSLIGMEGDIRRQANMDAVGEILGTRRQAEEDAFGRAIGVTDVSAREREMALEEEKVKWQMEAFDRWLESQGADGGGGGGGGVDITDDGPVGSTVEGASEGLINNLFGGNVDWDRMDRERAENKARGEDIYAGQADRAGASEVGSVDELPQGAEYVGEDSSWRYYTDADGNTYKVANSSLDAGGDGGGATWDWGDQ